MFAIWRHLHHGAAEEGNEQHEAPARDHVEAPQDVGKGLGNAQLYSLAIEGVPERVEKLELVALALEGDNLVRGNRGEVEALLVDVDGGGLRQHFKRPDGADAGGPHAAEDGLVVAVEHANVGSIGLEGELGGRLVECALDLLAVA